MSAPRRDSETASEHVRNALMLLDGLSRELGELTPAARAEADEILQAAARRLWKAVFQLEPQRARLAGSIPRGVTP